MEIVVFVLLIVALTALGGILIAQQPTRKTAKMLPLVISVGTGLLVSLSFVEFLPHAFEHQTEFTVPLILAGIFMVIIGDKYIAPRLMRRHSSHCSHHSHANTEGHSLISAQAACSSVGCLIVCAFFDGVQIYSGFQLGEHTGLLVGTGLLFHTVPEGALAAGMALAGGMSKGFARWSSIFVGGAILLGAVSAALFGHYMSFETYVLPFASGVLIYVALGHLLPVSIQTRYGLLGIVIGSLSLLAFQHSHIH